MFSFSGSALGKNYTIELLRGCAAFAVMWFHFSGGGNTITSEAILASGQYGYLGVEIFFVISGFVIPLSMSLRNYKLKRHFGWFMGKRLLRLEPAYLASVILCLCLLYLSSMAPGFKGDDPAVTLRQLLLHIAYLNAIFDEGWLNPVYWTLAIEFQYYLLIAIVYPLFSAPVKAVRFASLGVFLALSMTGVQNVFLLPWAGLFACGILVWWLHEKLIGLWEYLILLTLASLVIYVAKDVPMALAGIFTSLTIAFVRVPKSKWVFWIGALSYSVYLLHVPIGGRVINLAGRLSEGLARDLFALSAAIVISLAAAYVWYLLLERPSQRAASRISYET